MTLISLFCKALVIVNLTNLPWNEHDQQVLDRNKHFCEQKIPRSPCIKEFRKTGDQEYFILCGAMHESNRIGRITWGW